LHHTIAVERDDARAHAAREVTVTLMQVMGEYSQTPGRPFSLGGLLSSQTARWIAIGLGIVAVLYLFRRSRFSTILTLAAIAALIYYGRGWLGW
jgi:hypothetical protein